MWGVLITNPDGSTWWLGTMGPQKDQTKAWKGTEAQANALATEQSAMKKGHSFQAKVFV
jgi:hypothetical protein